MKTAFQAFLGAVLMFFIVGAIRLGLDIVAVFR